MRLVVIGGVAAGLSAAARARRCDPSLDITVLEKGPAVAWGACGLPYYLEGQAGSLEELVVYTPEYFRRERNIAVRTGAEVVAISHSRRQVVLADGERVPYDRLVVATGARPDRSIDGAGHPDIFTLSTLEDARRLRCFLDEKKPRRAAIVGAGYLGLELAEVFRTHGLAVTVFEAAPDVLGRRDAALTDFVRAHLERFQVELRLGARVESVEPGCVAGVRCDMAVLAAGSRPHIELAAEAGIQLGRTGAIRVSERMETNLAGVYAAGDCAEAAHLVTGRPVYFPLGTTANKMGRIAGANAAGRRERFPGVAGTCIVRVCGIGVAITGLSEAQARKEGFDPVEARVEAPDKPRYFHGEPVTVTLVADRGTRRLIGGTVIGREGVAGRINVLATAITNRMRIEDLEQLDLAYAPPFAPVWDPILIAAQQLMKCL
ncbi:MAG: FAD-dependent oxidoreductase [Bryobacteraceae bacterium]|jgi:NADPH-dependent 2,4-dienoyl-CoA reductase/sulfur reductase-like enzyme